MFFFLMIRRPPRSTLDRSSAASDVYKRQVPDGEQRDVKRHVLQPVEEEDDACQEQQVVVAGDLSLIHISEPTRPY